MDIGITEIAKIKLVERDFLVNRIKNGSEFRIGVFPNEIAIGKVIDLFSPSFGKYEIAYRFYKNGDFGSLKSF